MARSTGYLSPRTQGEPVPRAGPARSASASDNPMADSPHLISFRHDAARLDELRRYL